jgi:hypothetical protein
METINRNNYEEFFLLYADNELDTETKLAVEKFVEQNTDLAIELDMLLKTKSAPETMIFDDKDLLLRTEGNSINETNYEEYFLLYIDNELSTAKREEVEMYVLQHPRLQKEFINLKQAVLTPEAINYGNKEDLYRTEKKRTVYMRPWRFAAAAIFIGACTLGWWLWQKPGQTNTVAANHSTEIKPQQKSAAQPADTIEQQTIDKPEITAQQKASSTENKIAEEKLVPKKKTAPPALKTKGNDIAEQHQSIKKENIIIHNKPVDENNIVKQNRQPAAENNDVAIERNPSTSALTAQHDEEKINSASVQVDENEEAGSNGNKIYNVAYKEINPNDNDNSLHVGAFDLNKTKVKNLFKKAGRLFGNKQDNLADEDGKLQVANFEIQTKQQ